MTLEDRISKLEKENRRFKIAAAMDCKMPRQTMVAGFGQIDTARGQIKTIGAMMLKLSAGDLGAEDEEAQDEGLSRRTGEFDDWREGEQIEYRSPPRASN